MDRVPANRSNRWQSRIYLEAFRDGGERLRGAGVIKLTMTRDIMKFLAWDRAKE